MVTLNVSAVAVIAAVAVTCSSALAAGTSPVGSDMRNPSPSGFRRPSAIPARTASTALPTGHSQSGDGDLSALAEPLPSRPGTAGQYPAAVRSGSGRPA